MQGHCPSCGRDVPVKLETRTETYVVRGEPISVKVELCLCPFCGESISDDLRDEETLRAVYAEYRRKHGLLQPDEIRAKRERYCLSQRALSRLLGWGLVTIQRYESGALQDAAHDSLLRQLDDPLFVVSMLNRNEDAFSTREVEAIRSAAMAEVRSRSGISVVELIENWVGAVSVDSDELTGWRQFDLDRFTQVVLWLAHNTSNLYKTKLAKLLWLGDFTHFYLHRVSITGLAYARCPYGPVPHRFDLLLGALADGLKAIRLRPIQFECGEGEVVEPLMPLDDATLSTSEVNTLEVVNAKFGRSSSSRLSLLSHREPAWVNRKDGELIPYTEADKLQLARELAE